MKCPHCNQDHPEGTKFCPETGMKMPSTLLSCSNKECVNYKRYVLPVDSKFCPDCGYKLDDNTQSSHHKEMAGNAITPLMPI